MEVLRTGVSTGNEGCACAVFGVALVAAVLVIVASAALLGAKLSITIF